MVIHFLFHKVFSQQKSTKEKEELKENRSWNNQIVPVQEKGSRFVILDNNDYEQKRQTQINRSSTN